MIGEAQSVGERKRKAGGMKEMLQDATKLAQKLRFLVKEVRKTSREHVFVYVEAFLTHHLVLAHCSPSTQCQTCLCGC